MVFMQRSQFDLVVIGGGSGGIRAAKRYAEAGKKVAIIESNKWGGTCVNAGCIPKKLSVYAANFAHDFKVANDFGYDISYAFSWTKLVERNKKFIARLNDLYVKSLNSLGITQFNGSGKLINYNRIAIANKVITAEKILIATGTVPARLPIASEHFLTSDDIFYLDDIPQKSIVCGGGYIALELAYILNSLGSEVTIIHRGTEYAKSFDRDCIRVVVDNLKQQGISFIENSKITSVRKSKSGLTIKVNNTDYIETSVVINAIGRVANTVNAILDTLNLGLTEAGHIRVDKNFKTTFADTYAIGDVIGHSGLTPVAIRQAELLVQHWLSGADIEAIDYKKVPTAIFTKPEIAQVGATEQSLAEQNIKYSTKTTKFRPLNSIAGADANFVYMKLLIAEDDTILGAVTTGVNAAEAIQLWAIIIDNKITDTAMQKTIALHPTNAEEWLFVKQ